MHLNHNHTAIQMNECDSHRDIYSTQTVYKLWLRPRLCVVFVCDWLRIGKNRRQHQPRRHRQDNDRNSELINYVNLSKLITQNHFYARCQLQVPFFQYNVIILNLSNLLVFLGVERALVQSVSVACGRWKRTRYPLHRLINEILFF